MRIFNGTNSLLTLPLNGNQKLEILPKSISQEFMGNTDFLSMIVTSLSSKEIAIVVSGVYELNTCANIPTAVNYVVQSVDEAIIRFGLKKKKEPECVKVEEKCTCKKCEDQEKQPEPEPEPVIVEETPTEEPTEQPEPESVECGEETKTDEEKVEPVVEEKKPKKRSRKKKEEG